MSLKRRKVSGDTDEKCGNESDPKRSVLLESEIALYAVKFLISKQHFHSHNIHGSGCFLTFLRPLFGNLSRTPPNNPASRVATRLPPIYRLVSHTLAPSSATIKILHPHARIE